MSELFSAKRSRPSLDVIDVDEEPEQDGGVNHEEDEALESALRARQADIDDTHAELVEKLRELEAEYELKKRPLYKARGEVISRIPGFWLHCFMQHERVRQILGSIDQDILANLQELEIENLEEENSGYRIKLHFVENDKFSDKVLTKEVKFSFSDGQPVVCSVSGCSPNWIGPDLTKPETIKGGRKRGRDSVTFFRWFTLEKTFEPGLVDALADIIKDQIYLNPLLYLDAEQIEEKWDAENLGDAFDHMSDRLPNGSHTSNLAQDLWNQDGHTEVQEISDDELRDDDSNANEMSGDMDEAGLNEDHVSDAGDLEDDSDGEEGEPSRDLDLRTDEEADEQFARSDLEEELPDYEDGDRENSLQTRAADTADNSNDEEEDEEAVEDEQATAAANSDEPPASPRKSAEEEVEELEEAETSNGVENAHPSKELAETTVNIIQPAPDDSVNLAESGPPGFEENAGNFQTVTNENAEHSREDVQGDEMEGAEHEGVGKVGDEGGDDDDDDDLQEGSLDDLEDHGDIEPGEPFDEDE